MIPWPSSIVVHVEALEGVRIGAVELQYIWVADQYSLIIATV
jgi:hypothetical protein